MPQQKPGGLHPSPFRPENKVPGPFIPIIYPDPQIQNDKSKLSSTINNGISSGYFTQEQDLRDNIKLKAPQTYQTVEVSTSR